MAQILQGQALAVEMMMGTFSGAVGIVKEISSMGRVGLKRAIQFQDIDGNTHMHNLLVIHKPDEPSKVVRYAHTLKQVAHNMIDMLCGHFGLSIRSYHS